MILRFGFDSDNRRLYVINEIAIQAIGAGDIVLTGFAQDPTVYGYEQVAI
jgi:imidazole glycerol phosphate synthase subunit HisF